jgi:hypothetical protein
MLFMSCKIEDRSRQVLAASKQASIQNLSHAGAAIRLTARRSIRRSKRYAPEGKPPHTRRGQLKSAIAYSVERQQELVVIGPESTKVGPSGSAHEHGGKYKRTRYAKRPFMGPALTRIQPRIPKIWAGSIKTR